jgi:hypothetical protein
MDQILLNQEDSIEIEILFNGVLTDPSSIKIKSIQDTTGDIRITDDTNITHVSTGRYKYTVAAADSDELGIYTALWQFIILGTTYEHTQYYEVVTTIREGYLVPQELRDLSTLDLSNQTDTQLQKYINKATAIIDNHLGDTINYQQYAETIRCVVDKKTSGLHIQLRHRPIVTVTSVSVMTNPLAGSVSLDPADFRINNKAGYIEWFGLTSAIPSLRIITSDFTASPIVPEAAVVYTAGYTYVPARIQQATATLIEQLVNVTQGDAKELAGFTIGDYSERFVNSPGQKGVGQVGADPVFELLRGYRQPMRGTGFFGPLG